LRLARRPPAPGDCSASDRPDRVCPSTRNEHTILVHAEGAWSHDEHLDGLLTALDARRELVEPAVGFTVRQGVVAVSLWVEAGSEAAAWDLANRALVEEMGQLGLV
jgi:hypothetical protein